MNTNLDDWETDPDFVRDMDEIDQRWGSKRTVGSINMGKLIDDVQRDHRTIHESNHHSSQKNYTSGLDRNARPQVSQKTFSRRVITEKSESTFYEDSTMSSKEPEKRITVENTSNSFKSNPNLAPKPNLSDITSRLYKSNPHPKTPDTSFTNNVWTESPKQFKDSSITKHIFEDMSSASSPSARPVPAASNSASTSSTGGRAASTPAFKSIQDKIDAFKREFEQIESRVAKKSDISKVIKKSANTGKFDDSVEYVTRSSERIDQQKGQPQQQRATTTSPTEKNKSFSSSSGFRPSSTSPLHGIKKSGPQSSIKSLSEKFESLGRETSEDFRRRMDERRREFFDEIKSQVRETRKGLDGFDLNDSDQDESRNGSTKRHESDHSSGTMPKVYSRRETTQEKVVSRFVKENDKVIHDETKRNVERTSSCHGSSEDELDNEPASIKQLNRSYQIPVQTTSSPIDHSKSKTPPMDSKNKSSGLMARTLYDYRAAEDDELTFDIDDLITNIEKIDEGWYRGTMVRNGQKKVGLFPANYVKLLNDSSSY